MLEQNREGLITRTLMLATALLYSTAGLAMETILGKWKQIDDRTGQVRSIVEMVQEPDGTYTGVIIKRFPRPGMLDRCHECPPPFTNQPIDGLKLITGLKPSSGQERQYVDGRIIDPYTGKVYRMKAKVSPNGHTLSGRGYIGVSLLGRTQTWLRADE